MAGGLLNLVAYGNQNIILTGNPTKTFFKCTYAKHTNFGLQKFRLDYQGARVLRTDSSSQFSFKVPRYADLLMDTYLVVTLPHIWSPIFNDADPYEFKWIKHIGTQMIERVRFTIGGQTIQEYTGQYLHNMVERDFDAAKKELYYRMIGHTAELNDPANAFGRNDDYPNAKYTSESQGPEPSIRSRKLYIPLNIWFTMASKMAFPLASLQYNELIIDIDVRPVRELFVIKKKSTNVDEDRDYFKANFNDENEQFYMFLHPPPSNAINSESYTDKRTDWNADVHLISTYAFLSDDERHVFAENSQTYLIKQAYTHKFQNIYGPTKIKIDTMGMVANWTWFFQRGDVTLRNEWSNYTNWNYETLPKELIDEDQADMKITGSYQYENEKNIMKSWGLLFDGKYRENVMDAGVLDYIDKYARSSGNGPEGQYFYNFGLLTDPKEFQPSGAINLSKFKDIEFEVNVMSPPQDTEVKTFTVCNDDGNIVGINNPVWNMYKYTYDLTVMEERYNVLTFMSGNASLMYAR